MKATSLFLISGLFFFGFESLLNAKSPLESHVVQYANNADMIEVEETANQLEDLFDTDGCNRSIDPNC